MEKETLKKFLCEVLSLSARDAALLGLKWAFALSLLSASLIFLISRLFFEGLTLYFYLVPLFWFALAPIYFLKRPDPLKVLARVDQNLKMEERLVTSFEVIERNGPGSLLESLLLKDTCERLQAMKPREALPRRTSRKVFVLFLSALIVFSVAPFLPKIEFSGAPYQELISQASAILHELSFLAGPEKDQAYLEVLKAKKQLEALNFKEASVNLEEAKKLLEEAMEKDKETLQALEASEELSFLTWSIKNNSLSHLLRLEGLTSQERKAQAERIAEKLKNSPQGPLSVALEELANSLMEDGNDLEEVGKKLLEIQPREESAYASLDNLLSQLKDERAQVELQAKASGAQGQLEPGQGIGTQGGLSTSKEEDQSGYIKSPPNEQGNLSQGLIYLPPLPMEGKGEPLVLPQGSEGKYQIFTPGESQEGAFYEYREVLSLYEKSASEVFLRQAFPPDYEELAQRYYQILEGLR